MIKEKHMKTSWKQYLVSRCIYYHLNYLYILRIDIYCLVKPTNVMLGLGWPAMLFMVIYRGLWWFCVPSFKHGRFWHHERSDSQRWPQRQMCQRKSYQYSMPQSFLKQTSPMKQRLRAVVFFFSKLSHDRLVFNSPWSGWCPNLALRRRNKLRKFGGTNTPTKDWDKSWKTIADTLSSLFNY